MALPERELESLWLVTAIFLLSSGAATMRPPPALAWMVGESRLVGLIDGTDGGVWGIFWEELGF